MKKESSKDPVLAKVMRLTHEGWPSNLPFSDPVQLFRRISNSLSNCHGCLLYGIVGHFFDTLKASISYNCCIQIIWACTECNNKQELRSTGPTLTQTSWNFVAVAPLAANTGIPLLNFRITREFFLKSLDPVYI